MESLYEFFCRQIKIHWKRRHLDFVIRDIIRNNIQKARIWKMIEHKIY